MIFLYWIFSQLSFLIYKTVSWFNPKAALFVKGRKNWRKALSVQFENKIQPILWFHCASVGEFEQARPIIESLRDRNVSVKILLTFFSPSGYELRKNYDKVDVVTYLPLDSPTNAKDFVEIVKPDLAIFIKYEFWHYYIQALNRKKIQIWSVSSIFRREQIYFKWYGGFYAKILSRVNQFFVQNEESVRLLSTLGINQVIKSGDSRFDRVAEVAKKGAPIPLAALFSNNKQVVVAGSIWKEDIEVIIPFLKNNPQLHAIIAPHELKEEYYTIFEKEFLNECLKYSNAKEENVIGKRILWIDNVGMLSRLYRYGKYAYIGGAFGKGLHNTLEAACYGIPVFFGNKNYRKFLEASEMIKNGVAFAIANENEFQMIFQNLQKEEIYHDVCSKAIDYVNSKTGATKMVVEAIMNKLS
ncbi:MAG: 3-deoxy-D-manno-octulosonic acid transferase [Cyclobacteriaceae bacterium]|jgi:3-deoxy-D-manno-octulosonic-acid transferase|nr:3-deoxy-D-manno-octulosonic acid transferase [Cyclobacteriaceae bacterium]